MKPTVIIVGFVKKCLANYEMDCHDIWDRHPWCPEDEL